jgi:hypothetical protein
METRLLEGEVLGFTLSGAMSLEALEAAGRAIAKACLERRVPRAFADARPLTGDLSVLEWHRLAAGFETSWPPGLRLAVVDHADRVKPDRVMETTARNRGIDVRVFTDAPPALQWLRAWKPESA